MLKIKDGIDLKVLEQFGFKLGKDWVANRERFVENESDYDDYYKPSFDEEGNVEYSDERFNQVGALIHIQRRFDNRLWIEITPCYSYHTEGWELDMITDTLFDLEQAGLIEKEKQD